MRLFATLALSALLLAPAALAQSLGAPPAPAEFVRTAEAAPLTAPRVAIDTLYNQLDGGGSSSGWSLSENFKPANDAFDAFLADDVVVPAGETWTVGQFIVGGFYVVADGGTFVKPESYNVIVWADDGGRPGAEVFRADEIVPASDTGGELTLGTIKFSFEDPGDGSIAPVELAEGTYWVTAQANVDFGANGTRFAWYETDLPRADLGEIFQFYNPGGGFSDIGTCNTDWGGLYAECGFDDDGGGGNLTFALLSANDGSAIDIADARAQGIGATVTVEGTVSRAEGAFAYFQDETGGLTIRQTSGTSAFAADVASGAIAPGTTVTVTGTLTQFNGLLQISNADLASYEVTGQGDAPAPQVVTLSELATNGEAYEAELVRVENVTLTTADAVFQERTTYAIADATEATNAVSLRIPNAADSELDGTAIPGNPIAITGPVGQSSSTDPAAGYQIFGIADGDITGGPVAIGEDPEGRLALAAAQPNPSAREASLTVSLASAGRATLVVYDALGREVVRALDRDLAAGDLEVRFDVSALPAGTYLARLTANGGVAVRPFTVVR